MDDRPRRTLLNVAICVSPSPLTQPWIPCPSVRRVAPHGHCWIARNLTLQVGEHQAGLLDHLGESRGLESRDEIDRRRRCIEPPTDYMAPLTEEILHLCDSGVGVRFSERGDADHVA